jgi:poly-gamma-glutamate synthesis protein (capsule biosynthesis protein)
METPVPRRRLFVLLPFAAAAVTMGTLAFTTKSAPTRAAAAVPALNVTAKPTGWVAPGVRVTVGGFAGSGAAVLLRADGHVVARTTAGKLGRYSFSFAPRASGRVRLAVQSAGVFRPAGTLVVRPVSLDAVGDVTFGEEVGPAIADHGGAYPWSFVGARLREADITIGNLETAVSTRGTAAVKEFTFRGPPAALRPMRGLAGFDVLTLANNHTVDYGRDALLDTVKAVKASGIEPIGAGANEAQARRPAIVEAGGLRVAFLGYSDVNPYGFNATSDSPGTAKADVAAITKDVHAVLRRADVAVCFFHWGTELHPEPNSRQQQFAAACLNAGAKLVLGAHPHVLGGVATPARRSLVAWTLGNFVFPSGSVTGRTAILHVALGTDGVRGYRLVPVRIDGFRPRLARAAQQG